jgi:hypothetical protein
LKLDNKHVSRQQVKLSLNFATGLANVVSLGTNPTTVVRASGGELLLDANQLYAINPNDTICLWRAECRYRFVAQLKPGFSVPLLPDQPLVSDADAPPAMPRARTVASTVRMTMMMTTMTTTSVRSSLVVRRRRLRLRRSRHRRRCASTLSPTRSTTTKTMSTRAR